uniref:Uncharacterized protein n=1 Tax=viral metagenome TaxID=1070528 RepID=A0A6C0BN30_9ZZZZ
MTEYDRLRVNRLWTNYLSMSHSQCINPTLYDEL